MAKRGAAMLEMPEPEYAPDNGARRTSARPAETPRPKPVEDFADEYKERVDQERRKRPAVRRAANRSAVRLRLGSRMPQTTAGLVASALALLLLLAGVLWLLAVTREFLLHDARFRIAGAPAIEIEGNQHLKRAQLLAIFADDLGRNVFEVSLDQRKADLEALPWVERATVMRLLPGRLRVSLVERRPVAFVRQAGHIGLVDAHGVLLDMASAGPNEHDSFPVVTGIAANDPLSTRAARMKIFERFTAVLDSAGEKNTESLSEVDLSDPEDVRAMVEGQGTTVLVHFGDEQFLERFRRLKELLPRWHAQYPNLASADMRYEHEVPLGMAAPKGNTPAQPTAKIPATPASHAFAQVHGAAIHATAAQIKPIPPAAVKPAATQHPATSGFVPAPPVQPWQAVAKAAGAPAKTGGSVAPQPLPPAGTASASASARAGYAANVPVAPAKPLAGAPLKRVAKAPASAANVPGADRQSATPQAPNRAGPHAKPSAGKPLVTNDTNPNPQAAQR